MTQRDLEREFANATGESVTTIRRRGRSLVEHPHLDPLTVDWDEVQQIEPPRLKFVRPKRPRVAA